MFVAKEDVGVKINPKCAVVSWHGDGLTKREYVCCSQALRKCGEASMMSMG